MTVVESEPAMRKLTRSAQIATIIAAVVGTIGLGITLLDRMAETAPSPQTAEPGVGQGKPTERGEEPAGAGPMLEQQGPRDSMQGAETEALREHGENHSELYAGDRQKDTTSSPSTEVSTPNILQTESYRLSVISLQTRGSSVDLELRIESDREDYFEFAIYNPYLVDENGTRLDLYKDSEGLVERGVEILPGSKRRGILSFCAMMKEQVRVGGFAGSPPTCKGGTLANTRFTFSADEIRPVPRRKIILGTAR